MSKFTGIISSLTLACLCLVGSGCVAPVQSSMSAEEAAQSLSFSVGDNFTIERTVLGLSGGILEWFGDIPEKRVVSVTEWHPSEGVAVEWQVETQVETDASKAARAAHGEILSEVPIGEQVPTKPEPIYETQTKQGSVGTASLKDGTTLLLPDSWEASEMGDINETLIWLSQAQYNQLVSTRETNISLGKFDSSLAQLQETAGKYSDHIASLKELLAPLAEYGFTTGQDTASLAENEQTEPVTRVTAEGDWGTYGLKVNGARTDVRVIEASNSFATYKILANPQNPLILEIVLTPLSAGAVDLSGSKIVQGFGGYEVTEINQQAALEDL